MTLETPNRLTAAANVLVNPFASTVGTVYTFRSNNGFQTLLPTDDDNVSQAIASGWNSELLNKVSNDEGIVFVNSEQPFGELPFGWITPAWTQTGNADVDALPDYRLAVMFADDPEQIARVHVGVFECPSEYESVDGQPITPHAPS